MDKSMLFSIENCSKCEEVKKEIKDNVEIFTLPHDMRKWSKNQIKMVDYYGVLEDLCKTAPILLLSDGTKIVGQLRILKWLRENAED